MVEVTREVTHLSGKRKGEHSVEIVAYVCSLPMNPANAMMLLLLIRQYWAIEAGHHRLDVTAREDSSRVRHRNSLRVLGLARRTMLAFHDVWRAGRKNKRQSTLQDFYDEMTRHQHRAAWQLLKGARL